MVSYKGYLIYGKALLIHPNLQVWRSLGIVCAKTLRGSTIEIRHLERTVFDTREAAVACNLCKNWLDKNLPITKA
jgi:hypothetical protein